MTLEEFAAYWDDLSDPKVTMPISLLLNWKGAIEKLCTDVGEGVCSAQMETQVNALSQKIQSLTH